MVSQIDRLEFMIFWLLVSWISQNFIEDLKANMIQDLLLRGLLLRSSSCGCQTDTFIIGDQFEEGTSVTIDVLIRLIKDDQIITFHFEIHVSVVLDSLLAFGEEPEILEVVLVFIE